MIMKEYFGGNDAKKLRQLMLQCISNKADRNGNNYVLLSGGIDSLAVAFCFDELGLPFKAVNFKFADMESKDTESVKKLQEMMKWDVEYISLESENIPLIKDAVKTCYDIYGKIRKVKVETVYALKQVYSHLNHNWQIFSGDGGDTRCCYNRSDAIIIGVLGERHPEVIKFRKGIYDEEDSSVADEFSYIFDNQRYYTPYEDDGIISFFVQYTTKALNYKFPKSCLVYAFSDYFKKFKCARKPSPFQKASNEDIIFERMAQKYGFDSALKWFNAIHRGIQ